MLCARSGANKTACVCAFFSFFFCSALRFTPLIYLFFLFSAIFVLMFFAQDPRAPEVLVLQDPSRRRGCAFHGEKKNVSETPIGSLRYMCPPIPFSLEFLLVSTLTLKQWCLELFGAFSCANKRLGSHALIG